MKVFFYGGIFFLALGLLFVFTSIGSEGILSGSIFGFGTIFFAMGAVLTIVASPEKNKKEEQEQKVQKARLFVSRIQLAVGVLVSASFFLVFFIVYPGGVLAGPFANHGRPDDYLTASYTGLKEQYLLGDELEFSIEYQGYWVYDQHFQVTINKLENAGGMATDETKWFIGSELEGFPLNTSGTPVHINKVFHVGGNSTDALILDEAGLYAVVTEGRNIINPEKRFRVVNPLQNSSGKL